MIQHDDHDLLARIWIIFFSVGSYCKMIMFHICTCSLCVYFFFLHVIKCSSSAPIDKFNYYRYTFLFFFSSCIKLYKLSLSIQKIRPITKVYRIKTMPSAARAFHLLRLLLSLPFTPFFLSSFSLFTNDFFVDKAYCTHRSPRQIF